MVVRLNPSIRFTAPQRINAGTDRTFTIRAKVSTQASNEAPPRKRRTPSDLRRRERRAALRLENGPLAGENPGPLVHLPLNIVSTSSAEHTGRTGIIQDRSPQRPPDTRSDFHAGRETPANLHAPTRHITAPRKTFSEIHTEALALLAEKSAKETYNEERFIQWQEQIRIESFLYSQDQRTKAQEAIRDSVKEMVAAMGGIETMNLEQKRVTIKYLQFFDRLAEANEMLKAQLKAFLERHTPVEQQGVVAEYMDKELKKQKEARNS